MGNAGNTLFSVKLPDPPTYMIAKEEQWAVRDVTKFKHHDHKHIGYILNIIQASTGAKVKLIQEVKKSIQKILTRGSSSFLSTRLNSETK